MCSLHDPAARPIARLARNGTGLFATASDRGGKTKAVLELSYLIEVVGLIRAEIGGVGR
jgi:hypothetical protein